MRRAFDNLRRILQGAGLEFKDVVQVRSYVKNSGDVPRYNEIYREYFKEPYPARATVQVARLPKDARVEIDVIASYE